MFFKKWFLVNRFIVLDFYSNNFSDRGVFCAIAPPQSIALFKKLPLD
ncbi:hypothetical protein HPHPP3_0059 [Helicobacter pylori Hp P-3]|nr:hypothetical protein HPHPP3_0059 [Helicobacter pylori Hp P-3]EJC55729.1 hypothetical protein HPHPP3B_1658 [Helicobacter pylori Hp P-3b]